MNTKMLLEQIGGQASIARECFVSDSAVSQWAKDDQIPTARLQYLRLAHTGAHWKLYDEYQAKKAAGVDVETEQKSAGNEHAQASGVAALRAAWEKARLAKLIKDQRLEQRPFAGPDRRNRTDKPGRGA